MTRFLSIDKLSFLGAHRYHGGGEFSFDCPKCGGMRRKFHFGVNVRKGVFNCFRCGYSGHVSDLFMENMGFTLKVDGKAPEREARPRSVEIKDFFSLTGGELTTTDYARDLMNYIRNRCGMDQAYENRFGYSTSRRFWGRVIIPIFEDDELVYWVARSIYPELEPKEISPHREEVNVKRTEVVFGLDQVDEEGTLVVVEGIFDCLRLRRYGYSSVATLGAHVSAEQIGKIIAKDVTNIVFLSDGDEAGRQHYKKAAVSCGKRSRKWTTWTPCPDGRDPEDLTDQELDELIGAVV